MKIIITNNYREMSEGALSLIIRGIRQKPDLSLCVCTGSSPKETYRLLGEEYKKSPQLFDKLRIMKLDEWGGLPLDNPATCESYIRERIIKPLDITDSRFFTFDSNPNNLQEASQEIKERLAKVGKIDLCILGLGKNGHIALIEPSSRIDVAGHITKLSTMSKNHAMLKDSEAVPKYGITMSMSDIMNSRKIILLVSGKWKSSIFKQFLTKKVTARLPASFLWLHPNVVCICDREIEGRE